MSNKQTGNQFAVFLRRLKLEAISLAALMVALTYYSDSPLWVLVASFLLFDIGMAGYLINSKVGALTYNAIHDLTVPTLLIVVGLITDSNTISVIAYCWIFHVSVDRALGFGLKHSHSFHETHMGKIPK